MVNRTEERFGIEPDWQMADTVCSPAENLAGLVKMRMITPFIPLIDSSNAKAKHGRGLHLYPRDHRPKPPKTCKVKTENGSNEGK